MDVSDMAYSLGLSGRAARAAERSLDWLTRSIDGPEVLSMAEDPDPAPLRGDPELERLMEAERAAKK